MASTVILAGLGLTAVGILGKHLMKNNIKFAQTLTQLKLPDLASAKYYRGGFERTMTRREAALILGISQQSTKAKINESYRRIMKLNHPDAGGSHYLSAKISEAKELLDKP